MHRFYPLKKLWHRCFFVKFCEISKNTLFYRTPLVAASRVQLVHTRRHGSENIFFKLSIKKLLPQSCSRRLCKVCINDVGFFLLTHHKCTRVPMYFTIVFLFLLIVFNLSLFFMFFADVN